MLVELPDGEDTVLARFGVHRSHPLMVRGNGKAGGEAHSALVGSQFFHCAEQSGFALGGGERGVGGDVAVVHNILQRVLPGWIFCHVPRAIAQAGYAAVGATVGCEQIEEELV